MVSAGWIDATYPGVDTQERIREFIRDARDTWGAVWFLLGSDTQVIPARRAYAMTCEAGGHPDEDAIGCDLYYADLDGTWNADGDEIYGETEDAVDLYPDHRQQLAGLLFKVVLNLTKQTGVSRDRVSKTRAKPILEQRHQFMANPVAIVAQQQIGGVNLEGQLVSFQVGNDLFSTNLEQGPHDGLLGRNSVHRDAVQAFEEDPRQTRRSRTPEQLQ